MRLAGAGARRDAAIGGDTPLGRPAQPAELAPTYVVLASGEASRISGALLTATGGHPVL